MEKERKVLYSGMQATGRLTIGNYIGALKNWVNLNEEYDCFFGVMDLHSLTVRQNPAEFRKNARLIYTQYVAAGLDPKKNCIYFQSHVPAHAELGWILDCFTYMGELNRMTQFKDKSAKHADNINAGLFTYPSLMAADILLYQTDLVPIGADQKQHLEICSDIAERMNNIYGDIFTIPEGYFPKTGARIMSLAEPTKKMSKSDENVNATIYLIDDRDTIIRKFKKAVTDSDAEVRYDVENKPGVSNLMEIYGVVTGKTMDEVAAEFAGKGYGDFKLAVGEAVSEELRPVRESFARLMNDKAYLEATYKAGAGVAQRISDRTLTKVKKKTGLLARPF